MEVIRGKRANIITRMFECKECGKDSIKTYDLSKDCMTDLCDECFNELTKDLDFESFH